MKLGTPGVRWAAACWIGSLIVVLAIVPAMAQESIDVPDLTARSVFAFDPDTGEVILEEEATTRMPIGSITKVMTALVVIDHASLDEQVTITEDDMVGPGYSSMLLRPGDTLSVEQLLTGMLVVSGGDAARALARHVGSGLAGTDDPDEAIEAFVNAMNEKAVEIQLDDTRFANPDGEDDDDAWSTARDVAIMFAFMQANPVLAEMSGQASYELVTVGPEATPYAGTTTNQLTGSDGISGAKTGSTMEAGGCIVLAREGSSGTTEIIAVLGSDLEYDEETWTTTVDERWTDAQIVMEAIDTNWEPGTNLPTPEPTGAPEPTTAPAFEAVDETPEPQVTLATSDDGDGDEASTSPILSMVVAAGTIVVAGALAWSRIVPNATSPVERGEHDIPA